MKTFIRYLIHPSEYRIMFRLISRKIQATVMPERYAWSHKPFSDWCAEHVVELDVELTQIFGQKPDTSFFDLHRTELETAQVVADNCPVKMGGAGDLELLYHCAEGLKATRVIETGVAYGWSSFALLLSLANRTDAVLVSTDKPYPGRDNGKYVGCIVPHHLEQHWAIIPQADRQSLPKALKMLPELDLCHYDSDKRYQGRTWAYPLLWKALRPGGIFISDDIDDNPAFHDFCKMVGQHPWIVKCDKLVNHGKYVGILTKKA